MTAITSIAGGWPKWPYRGLDFYRESEAALFDGRTSDIERCADLLLGFGVKVLLLQGSSGSGKSSFIRAGLLPFLKKTTEVNSRQQSFFLNSDDNVIRCTTDPLRVIAHTILSAIDPATSSTIDRASPFTSGFQGEQHYLPPATIEKVREKVMKATEGSRLAAHEPLVEALVLLVSDLPGRLVIVLDQAEEVLTRSNGTDHSTEATSAFFRFLEDVYLRSVDVRIIVSLRTEFYGLFRDELAISDSRFSSKTSRGGVEPFLLRPLRSPAALKRIILAPTESDKPYNFSIDDDLADTIVADLLQQLPHSSVTPALQVICASLYGEMGRERRLRRDDYNGRGGFRGIIRKYLEDGIAQAAPASNLENEEWHLLLHSLVSRQSGGTIVSLTESVAELEKRATERRIPGPIKPRLIRLATGRVPLLRAEPPTSPLFFSLKHDVLAIILSRWFDEHDGAIRAREQERIVSERLRTRDRHVFWGVIGALVTAAVVIGTSVAWYAYDKGRTAYESGKAAMALRNAYVERAPQGDYRQILLGTLATLKRLEERSEWYGLYRAPERLRDGMVASLRNALPRVPRFAGKNFLAVGFDSEHGQIATLKQDEWTGGLLLEVRTLPANDNADSLPSPRSFAIPRDLAEAASEGNMFVTTTGFLTELGPAVYLGGRLFFWDANGNVLERDVVSALPPTLRVPVPRAEFVGGALQINYFNWLARDNKMSVLRLKAEDLKKQPIPAQEKYRTFAHFLGEPFPLFSEGVGSATYLSSFARGELLNGLPDGVPVERGSTEKGQRPFLLSLRIGRTDGEFGTELPVSVVRRRPVSPLNALEPRRATFAFVENFDGLILKTDAPRFEIVAVEDGGRSTRRLLFELQAFSAADWDLSHGSSFLHPPIAASKVGDHWRAAWVSEDGVWAIKTESLEGGIATPEFSRPLMAGESGGIRLQFLRQGRFLVLLQQRQWGAGISVRLWDLRAAWRSRVHELSEHELTAIACQIVGIEGSTMLTATDVERFQVPIGYRDPCAGKDKN